MRTIKLVVLGITALAACPTYMLDALGDADMDGEKPNLVDSFINSTFSRILGETIRIFALSDGGLPECGDGGAHYAKLCRRSLKNEPDDAKGLVPFLLSDKDAMKMWGDHFRRHVKEAIGVSGKLESPDIPLHAPGLKTLAENEFWNSRPAVSAGALDHLKLKMDQLRKAPAAHRVDSIHSVTWEAEVSPRFKYHSVKDAKALMGTYLSSYTDPDKPPFHMGDPLAPKLMPDFKPVGGGNFDAREAFHECRDVIGRVRDQGDCGSCWAFGSTEALNDRMCIKTRGKHREVLSTQHTTSCCDLLHCLSFGCFGGQPRMAWRWLATEGVVTGGDYSELHEGKSCWPYEVPFCQHHSSGPYPKCDSDQPKTPKCRKNCEEDYYTSHVHPFKNDLHFAAKAFSITGREKIKREITDNGTLTGAFLVFEDFLMYKSGVYHHISGLPLGGHAVKVIGYGNQDGRDYWLAVNSWNEYWGDKGTFKIQMGEAGIDNEFCGGEAKISQEEAFEQQAAQDL